VYYRDWPTTQRTDGKVELVVAWTSVEDLPKFMGNGWYDNFAMVVRARYPASWDAANSTKVDALVEELEQVIRDNWSWLSDASEQAVLRHRRIACGWEPKGDQIQSFVEMTVTYEGPGLAATP
jgi:hypothetical protein